MLDSKIYFFQSEKKKNQNKTPKQKTKLYSYIQCQHLQSTYIGKHCFSSTLWQYCICHNRVTKTIASAVIQTPWFYILINTQGKKQTSSRPCSLVTPAACVQSSRAGFHTCFSNCSFSSPTVALLEVVSFPDPNLNEKFAVKKEPMVLLTGTVTFTHQKMCKKNRVKVKINKAVVKH